MTAGTLAYKRVLVIAAGGLGQEVRDAIDATLSPTGIPFGGFLDDGVEGSDVVGPVSPSALSDGDGLVVAVGDPQLRRRLTGRFPDRTPWMTVLHPSAVVSPRAVVGAGNFIGPLSYVGPRAQLGRHVIINVHAEVGHDAIVGDWSTISPLAALNGSARLGQGCFLGSQSSLDVAVSLGDWSKVAAGSRVAKSFGPGHLVAGNPARGRQVFRSDGGE